MKKIAIAIILFCTLYSAYSLDYRQVIFGNSYKNIIEIDADAFFEQYSAAKDYPTGWESPYAYVYEQIIGEKTFYRVIVSYKKLTTTADFLNWGNLYFTQYVFFKKSDTDLLKLGDGYHFGWNPPASDTVERSGLEIIERNNKVVGIMKHTVGITIFYDYSEDRTWSETMNWASYCLWTDIVKLEEEIAPTMSYANWQADSQSRNPSIYEIQIISSSPLIDSTRPFMYTIQNAFDGNPATSYVEDNDNDMFGIGFNFGDAKEATMYKIINGYASNDYYYQNNQISKINISKNGAFQLKDTLEPQIISIATTEDNSFSMYVEEITKGTKYNDTCLAELDIYIEDEGWLFNGNLDADAIVTSLYEDNVISSTDGYAFTVEDGTTEIVGYNGKATRLNIPSTLEYQGKTYTVTSIGDRAFGSKDLTSVTIPDSVTLIGNNAFFGCKSLTSIIIPNSVISIGEYAFYGCKDLTSVIIPNSLTSIGEYAFYGCKDLTSVIIPNSLTSIGEYSFFGSGLTSISIPSSVISIGEKAFSECNNLTSVTIYGNNTSIGQGAFSWCENLIAVTISGTVTSIGPQAFEWCPNLVSVTISDSVTYIGWWAFYRCDSLTSITIPNSVTSISNSTFRYCESLTSVIIPDSVTSIGEDSFLGCDSLKSITIPSSVTFIDWGAFYDCKNLTVSVFPGSYALRYAKENDIPYILVEGE